MDACRGPLTICCCSRPRHTRARTILITPSGACWSRRCFQRSKRLTNIRRSVAVAHFIRRTKEEMVHLNGKPLYPKRISDTLGYDLTQGPISEQTLYEETTDYMRHVYNRAKLLNRSAARLAMSVLQRRLASSTYALLRSFERRIEKLDRPDRDKSRRASSPRSRSSSFSAAWPRTTMFWTARRPTKKARRDGRGRERSRRREPLGRRDCRLADRPGCRAANWS